jgi:hypothetical protein
VIVRAQFAKPQPIAQGDLGGVADAQPRLKRRTDQSHAPERPEPKTPKTLRRILVDYNDRASLSQTLERSDKTGHAAAGDKYIGLMGDRHGSGAP